MANTHPREISAISDLATMSDIEQLTSTKKSSLFIFTKRQAPKFLNGFFAIFICSAVTLGVSTKFGQNVQLKKFYQSISVKSLNLAQYIKSRSIQKSKARPSDQVITPLMLGGNSKASHQPIKVDWIKNSLTIPMIQTGKRSRKSSKGKIRTNPKKKWVTARSRASRKVKYKQQIVGPAYKARPVASVKKQKINIDSTSKLPRGNRLPKNSKTNLAAISPMLANTGIDSKSGGLEENRILTIEKVIYSKRNVSRCVSNCRIRFKTNSGLKFVGLLTDLSQKEMLQVARGAVNLIGKVEVIGNTKLFNITQVVPNSPLASFNLPGQD